MKKYFFFLYIINIALLSVLLIACFSPWMPETNTKLTIYFNGIDPDGRAVLWPPLDESGKTFVRHEVTLKTAAGSRTFPFDPGVDVAEFDVVPGRMDIIIEAYHEELLFAKGERLNYQVIVGINNPVRIEMKMTANIFFNVGNEEDWEKAKQVIEKDGSGKTNIIDITDSFSVSKSLDIAGERVIIRGYGNEISWIGSGHLFNIKKDQDVDFIDLVLIGSDENINSLVGVSGKLTMGGTSSISDNYSAGSGGGVYVYESGDFTMKGNTSIFNNYSIGGSGGGIYVNSGKFTMESGEIFSNYAGFNGGGVCIEGGTFDKKGGIIFGNNGGNKMNSTPSAGLGYAIYAFKNDIFAYSNTNAEVDLFCGYRDGVFGFTGGWGMIEDGLKGLTVGSINVTYNNDRIVTPIDAGAPGSNERTANFFVNISDIENATDANDTKLIMNIVNGLTITGYDGGLYDENSFTLTYTILVTYDGTTQFPNGSAELTIAFSTPNGYRDLSPQSIQINIRDGQSSEANRQIPINENNIRAFNEYARTTDGLTKNYILIDDIYLDTPPNTGESNWTAIGNGTAGFSGSFDGAGFAITNMIVEQENYNYQGMFGRITSGTVKNLGLVYCRISGDSNIGGITGAAEESIITQCFVIGDIEGIGNNVGGIAGSISGTQVTYNVALNSSITALTAGNNSGRVYGGTFGSNSNTNNNYARSDMLVNGSTVTNGAASNKDGENITSIEWNSVNWWTGLGFTDSMWGNNLPPAVPAITVPNVEPDTSWYNTTAQSFEISTAAQLAGLALIANNAINLENFGGKIINLLNDINLASFGSNYNGGKGWIPIGNDPLLFQGIFDGKGKIITGLYINDTTGQNLGLFGATDETGRIRNVGLVGAEITGGNTVGGIVGLNLGMVSNCYTTGSIEGNNYIGGIAGRNNSGEIEFCYSAGSVNGIDDVGGITGNNQGGTILNCYSTGNIHGTTTVGGIAGYSTWLIGDCYSTGDITGNNTSNKGGIVGYAESGTIRNSYSTGNIGNANTGSSGGIAGGLGDQGTIINCVSINQRLLGNANTGRIVGINDNGNLIKNYARDDMLVNGSAQSTSNTNGEDVIVDDLLTQIWWANGADWDMSNPWYFSPDGWGWMDGFLPTLREMPAGTQNPTVP